MGTVPGFFIIRWHWVGSSLSPVSGRRGSGLQLRKWKPCGWLEKEAVLLFAEYLYFQMLTVAKHKQKSKKDYFSILTCLLKISLWLSQSSYTSLPLFNNLVMFFSPQFPYMTLGKSLNFSEPHFLFCKTGTNMWESSKIRNMEVLWKLEALHRFYEWKHAYGLLITSAQTSL